MYQLSPSKRSTFHLFGITGVAVAVLVVLVVVVVVILGTKRLKLNQLSVGVSFLDRQK